MARSANRDRAMQQKSFPLFVAPNTVGSKQQGTKKNVVAMSWLLQERRRFTCTPDQAYDIARAIIAAAQRVERKLNEERGSA